MQLLRRVSILGVGTRRDDLLEVPSPRFTGTCERSQLVLVRTNLETKRVVLSGVDGSGWYELELSWSQALNLGSLLQQASHEIEPPAPTGRTYEPVAGR